MRMIRREQGAINGARVGWMLVAWVASFTAYSQTNAWIKSTSGDWEEPEWSLGMLPGIGQAVQITNPGWKAVAIGVPTVVFGNGAAGLNLQQLEQIQFIDAAGFPGTNNARILVSGEIVPTTRPYLRFSRQGGALVLSWTGDSVLESAPDILGPYEPVIGATSPYAPSTTVSAMAFFRLKQP